MPTGYTAGVADGTIADFNAFVMGCARAFGALILMRDDPMDASIPERFEPSSFYANRLAEARGRLEMLEAMTPEQAQVARDKAHDEAVAGWKRREVNRVETRNRYQAMLAQVVQWEPPTLEHQELKTFMIDQLHQSIEFDCSSEYDTRPVTPPAEQWLSEQRQTARRDRERYLVEHAKEVERTEGRNRWIQALRDSLSQTTVA
jgi:hypothetical protein